MNDNLQLLHSFIKETYPKLEDRKIIKIIFSIKARLQFTDLWISRYEATKFWVSERTMRWIISLLRNYWLLILVWKKKSTSYLWKKEWRLCNIYKMSDSFIDMFHSLEFFAKKMFEYIDPLTFIKTYFRVKFKRWIYKFELNWNYYQVATRWKFMWKIYWFTENKIINPYELLKLLQT